MSRNYSRPIKKTTIPLAQIAKTIYFYVRTLQHSLVSSEDEWNMIDSLVPEGSTVLDVGANIGRYTFKLSSIVGNRGRVIAIEPNVYSFSILSCITTWIGRSNISLLNLAAFSEQGFVSLTRDFKAPPFAVFTTETSSSISNHATNVASSLSVMSFPLDLICGQMPVSFIKIDVEGSEFGVLLGAKDLLRRRKPILLIEITDPRAEEFLTEMGYVAKSSIAGSRNKIFIKEDKSTT